MCQYLDPACFMANVFANCPDRKAFSFVTLRQVRDHVTESLAGRNVVIEWTRDAVLGALECYPNLFVGGDSEVTWRGPQDRTAVRQSFDGGFPDEFVAALNCAIREGCGQDRQVAQAPGQR